MPFRSKFFCSRALKAWEVTLLFRLCAPQMVCLRHCGSEPLGGDRLPGGHALAEPGSLALGKLT